MVSNAQDLDDFEPLLKLGFRFDKGRLVNAVDGSPFVFNVNTEHSVNQARYEGLGEVITEYVYHLLEKQCGLEPHSVPIGATESEPKTQIFLSPGALKKDLLLVLIHGSGVVRAGQWSRKLIINRDLGSGSQVPFIEQGLKDNFGIVVLNTNDCCSKDQDGHLRKVLGSSIPVEHGLYVFQNFVFKSVSREIVIIAHSYGGVVTVDLGRRLLPEFQQRVSAICLTDSVHTMYFEDSNHPFLRYFKTVAKNWVSSVMPLDRTISKPEQDCESVSAGTSQHELTSWSSFDSIFKFIKERLALVGNSRLATGERLPESIAKSACKGSEAPSKTENVCHIKAECCDERKPKCCEGPTVETNEPPENCKVAENVGKSAGAPAAKRERLEHALNEKGTMLKDNIGT